MASSVDHFAERKSLLQNFCKRAEVVDVRRGWAPSGHQARLGSSNGSACGSWVSAGRLLAAGSDGRYAADEEREWNKCIKRSYISMI